MLDPKDPDFVPMNELDVLNEAKCKSFYPRLSILHRTDHD